MLLSGTKFVNRGWRHTQTWFFAKCFCFGSILMIGEEEGYPRVSPRSFSYLRGRQWVREHIIARENVIFVFLPLKKCQKTCVFIVLPILQTIYKAWRAVLPIVELIFFKNHWNPRITYQFHFEKSIVCFVFSHFFSHVLCCFEVNPPYVTGNTFQILLIF